MQDLKTANIVAGTKQVLKALAAGSAKTVYIADDADSFIKDRIADECLCAGITPTMVKSMAELGKACGIAVKCASAAELA